MSETVDLATRRAAAIEATRPLAEAMERPEPIPDHWLINQPGVVHGMPAHWYHRDPVVGGSLSHSGSVKLLAPSCPAKYRYAMDHPDAERHSEAFDLGKAAHRELLGAGEEVVVIDADSWRVKAAQQQRDEAYAAGLVPRLRHQQDRVVEMIKALRQHPLAAALFDPDRGQPEVTLAWQHHKPRVWRRARIDWLPDPRPGRLLIPDFKTADCAHPETWKSAAARYHYHSQADYYDTAARALNLGEDPALVFVVQETTPPYLVSVIELDQDSVQLGGRRNRRALEIFARCQETGVWPGYGDEVALVGLPAWADWEPIT